MICKAELEALAKKYAAKADKAYQNYQETGISRYSREYHNALEESQAVGKFAGWMKCQNPTAG